MNGPSDDLLVLGIETSCDEPAAAVVARGPDGRGRILSNVVRSQWEAHRPYGGVVPEIAARAHVECLDDIIRVALVAAGVTWRELGGVAAAAGPGLVGGLIVGLTTAKTIALVQGLPLAAVNHLEAHALTVGLTEGLSPPYLLLLVSGGHTQVLLVADVGHYRRLGTTIDDALGEAFDKTAKLLGLDMPGGPHVERAALDGDAQRVAFPRPMHGRAEPNFSFAALKTAVRIAAEGLVPLNCSSGPFTAIVYCRGANDVCVIHSNYYMITKPNTVTARCQTICSFLTSVTIGGVQMYNVYRITGG